LKRFTITDLPLAGLRRIGRQRLGDSRGFLARLFCAEELAAAGWCKPIVQINHTRTTKAGAVRGLHFQRPPHAEMKLVICLSGEVWDVAVDLRQQSPTFLRWHAEVLSAENGNAMLIPEGFAHGFQALTGEVEMFYCHSAPHSPEFECGLNPADPALAIPWPLAIAELSTRDREQLLLPDALEGSVL